MRQTAFTQEEIKAATGAATNTGAGSSVFNLEEHMMKPAKNNVADSSVKSESNGSSNNETPDNKAATGNPDTNEPSATFDNPTDKDYENFKNGVTEVLEEADVQSIAAILVSIGNVGRIFILPNAYEALMYPGTERTDIRETIKKVTENMKANKLKEEGFNDYDHYLYEKWPKLRSAIENISYTQPEIDKLASMIARRIKDMTIAVWLVKYDWLLYILFLELAHGKSIIDQKGTDFFMAKFKPAKEAE